MLPYEFLNNLQPICLFVLRFYGPVTPIGSCRVWSIYLTTLLLGRLSPLSSPSLLTTFLYQKLTNALLESAKGRTATFTSNSVFRENRCHPTVNLQLFFCCDFEKLDQGQQNLISSLLCPNYISIKFGKNPITSSQDIVQTRKCDNDANAKGICIKITKINMSPSPYRGGRGGWT